MPTPTTSLISRSTIDAGSKNELNINIELASPDLFIPVPENWAERSDFVERYGEVDVFHFDYRGQALAKISRGHERDLLDVDVSRVASRSS